MRVPCSKSFDKRFSDEYGREIEGVCVSCGRCEASQFSFGRHRKSTERCLTLLNENCPKDENNYYAIGSGGPRSGVSGAVALSSLGDLSEYSDISGKDKHTIATVVQEWGGAPHEFTLWLPAWLVAEKNLVPEDRSEQVFTGICDTDTEKAWLIKQKPYTVKEWVPKSVAHAFRRGSAFSVPQAEEEGETA